MMSCVPSLLSLSVSGSDKRQLWKAFSILVEHSQINWFIFRAISTLFFRFLYYLCNDAKVDEVAEEKAVQEDPIAVRRNCCLITHLGDNH